MLSHLNWCARAEDTSIFFVLLLLWLSGEMFPKSVLRWVLIREKKKYQEITYQLLIAGEKKLRTLYF